MLPYISTNEEEVRAGIKGKVRTVHIQVDDADLLNFITGG